MSIELSFNKTNPCYGPDSNITKKKWTETEDKLLIKLAENIPKGKEWKIISNFIPGKTANQCRSRWERIRPGIKQGRWSTEEDDKIKSLYKKYGDQWTKISKIIQNRTGKQVRERIKNILSTNSYNEPFTQQNFELLYKLYKEMGPRWMHITKNYFPSRTPDYIKNKFYIYYRKIKGKKIKIKKLAKLNFEINDIKNMMINLVNNLSILNKIY